MNKRFLLLFCLSAISFGAHTEAEDRPRSVDAEALDISGVKLGMDAAEAVKALCTARNIDSSAIQFDQFPSVNPITPAKEPRYFKAKLGLGEIVVHLTPKVPYDKSTPMRVSMVIYEMPWTPDNVKAMKVSAIEKYGQPSNGTVGVTYQWCKNPDKNPGLGCPKTQGAILEFSGTKIQLHDPVYQNAVTQFMQKSQSGRPAF